MLQQVCVLGGGRETLSYLICDLPKSTIDLYTTF